jgi:hypothetical protein
MKARALLETLEGFHLGPTDMTKASLIDALVASTRNLPNMVEGSTLSFNSMTIMFDEWGTLLSNFEGEIVSTLTSCYDVIAPVDHARRHKETRLRISSPQLSIIAGSTPAHLSDSIPDIAWGQGFCSRLLLVYSGERNIRDDFAAATGEIPTDLIHDLQIIFHLQGGFTWTDAWHDAVDEWRKGNEEPRPTHPRLVHYNARRRAHLYKLAMVAAVDRGDQLVLDRREFDIALGWMHEIERTMPDVFAAGASSVDARAMDEIENFVASQDKPITEGRILRFASNLLPAHSVIKVLYLMQVSKRLREVEKGLWVKSDDDT